MAPLQCQREAARFASRDTRIEEIRKVTNQAAIRHLVLGDSAAALRTVFEGLHNQAPLSFKPPSVVTVLAAGGDVDAEVAR